MLRFDVSENKLAFSSGGWLEPQPTRYEGEPWDWIAAELACGIADPFPDVGLLVEAKRQIRGAPPLDAARWTKAAGSCFGMTLDGNLLSAIASIQSR